MNIIIPGPPIAQQRHRRKNIGGKIWDYDPLRKEKERIGQIMKSLSKKVPDEDEYYVFFRFYLEIPKSFSKKKKSDLMDKACKKKPDLDNYLKFYLDAGNEILWSDDSKISYISCMKIYSDNPRTEIRIEGYL